MDINTLHNTILNKFSNSTEDEKIAEALEDLFNYLIYDKKEKINTDNIFTQVLLEFFNEESRLFLQSQLQKRFPFLGDLSSLSGKNQNETGVLLENLIDIVGQMIVDPNSINDLTLFQNQTITGQDQRIVALPDELVKNFYKNTDKKIRFSKNKIYKSAVEDTMKPTVPKQLKTDVNWNNLTMSINLEGEINSKIVKILSASFTAKNYYKFPVHLGNVIPVQAYASMVQYLTNRDKRYTPKGIIHMYKYYLEKDQENIFLIHLTHMIKINALVGAGDLQVNSSGIVGMTEVPKFLIINNREKEKVIVRSTKKIIEVMMKNSNESISSKISTVGVYYNSKGNLTIN